MAIIVFDNDDTLVLGTAAIYSKAQVLFHLYLHEIFGPRMVSHLAVNNLYQKIDTDAIPDWGTGRGRVAHSMLKVYREVYKWAEKRFDLNFSAEEHRKHSLKIRELGDLPFDHSQVQWFPEAKNLLEKLMRAGHTLFLLTNYDPREWPKRSEELGIEKFFAKKHILPVIQKKTAQDFIQVSDWNEKMDKYNLWVAVGNSEIDVLPPLDISPNWRGIHIPYGSNSSIHSFHSGINLTPTVNHPKVINIQSLKELESALDQHLKSAR